MNFRKVNKHTCYKSTVALEPVGLKTKILTFLKILKFTLHGGFVHDFEGSPCTQYKIT